MACSQTRLPILISETLLFATKNALIPLIFETLSCLNNFVANCDTAKRVCVKEMGKHGVVESIFKVLNQIALAKWKNDNSGAVLDGDNEDLFSVSIQILKMMALYSETKITFSRVRRALFFFF